MPIQHTIDELSISFASRIIENNEDSHTSFFPREILLSLFFYCSVIKKSNTLDLINVSLCGYVCARVCVVVSTNHLIIRCLLVVVVFRIGGFRFFIW